MKSELKEKFLNILEESNIKNIIENDEFYFEKAIDKYKEFMALNKLGEEITDKIINRVNELKNANNFNYINLLNEFDKNSCEYKVLLSLGELVTYIDMHGSNKKEFNKYEDNRTIANAYVRQYNWVINLLKYKQTEDIDLIPETIKNAIRYLLDPEKVINVLSDKHRKLIALYLFKNQNAVNNFDEILIKEMDELNIEVINEKNKTLVYSRILYSNSIKSLWNFSQTIWKVSHGNDGSFDDEEKERYIKRKIITVHKETGKSQGRNFVETMKIGDLFYLCYGGKSIKLLGVITSEAKPLEGNDEGWMERNYEVIKESINTDKYKGENKGWAPTYNSTCMSVKQDHLAIFEKEILIPYFNISMEKLIENSMEYLEVPLEESTNEVDNGSVDEDEKDSVDEFEALNYILYGPPGTGKTYNTVNYAVAMIENKDVASVKVEDHNTVKERFEDYKNKGQIIFTTFHQSYGYEEFIEGIKPNLDSKNDGEIEYILQNGIFKQICEAAESKSSKRHVIIIDEINRGNISKIFGELITLIEKSKRNDAEEGTSTMLPYSKKEFNVPKNLYILGTMNTADRSIALLDTALRRRFEFIEIMPESSIFKKLNNNEELLVEEVNISNMLEMMNKRIEILYDREHTIGHAYFMDLLKDKSIDKLSNIFVYKIIPLLQEYFYDDYEKIRLIFGDNQIKDEDLQFINVSDIPNNIFGTSYDTDIIEDKKVYSINKGALTDPRAYIKIYRGIVEDK